MDERVVWTCQRGEVTLTGAGAQHLLNELPTAFFASRQCPGLAIRAAMDWALVHASGALPVVSGFHSPLEQSVLKVLLQSSLGAAVVVLARPVSTASLPAQWLAPLKSGRMAVVSAATSAARLTAPAAAERNELAARLAGKIVVAHASPGGGLQQLLEQWQTSGRSVTRLA